MADNRWSDVEDLSGQRIRITNGPFQDFEGVIEYVSWPRGKLRVTVEFFGRKTPVELDFSQVEKLKAEPEDN